MNPPAIQAPNDLMPSPDWKVFARLPDPVGFGGMFAGTLGTRLVTGGGSQFRNQPFWLGGQKNYSDRIFTSTAPEENWREETTRMPEKCGHFASAASPDAIYLVGGLGTQGPLRSCFALHERGGTLAFSPLPDFPVALCYGSAAIAAGRLLVVGGQQSPDDKKATTEVWSLELASPHAWRAEPNFPGAAVFVAAMASDGKSAFVLGGMSFDANGRYKPSNEAHRFNLNARQWERLPDLPAPRVGAATPALVLAGEKILLIGGYAEVFSGAPREHPGFSTQTLVYDLIQRRWSQGPVLPRVTVTNRDSPSDEGPGPVMAAPCTLWKNQAVVIGGETRSGARTASVMAWPFASGLRPSPPR